MAFEHDKAELTASNSVFNTYELICLIASHLDCVSLVRLEGVSRTFRDIIKDNTSLQQQLGAQVKRQEVLNIADTTCSIKARWNPLLYSWFGHSCISPLDAEVNIPESAVINLHPRALRAVNSPSSSIHHICITQPPVNCIRLVLPRANALGQVYRNSVIIRDEHGVTLGAVFKAWSTSAPVKWLGMPISIKTGRTAASIAGLYSEVVSGEDKKRLDVDVHGKEWAMAMDALSDTDVVSVYNETRLDNELREWYRRTVGHGDIWFGRDAIH